MKLPRITAAIGGLAVLGSLAAAPALAGDVPREARLTAALKPLNDSGVRGVASARVDRRTVERVALRVRGVTPAGPHAAHIHFGQLAAQECPTFRQDADGNFRLNVVEGVPKYGPVALSLTERGDTSPASALALDRMPTAEDRRLTYLRTDFRIGPAAGAAADGGTLSGKRLARAIRSGKGVVVVHGVDYNRNGAYDLDGAGESELAAGVPAEATDPAACGVLDPRQ